MIKKTKLHAPPHHSHQTPGPRDDSYVGIKPASPNEIMSLLNITELRFFNEFSTSGCTTSFSNIIAV